jgi:hypothetical protein
MKKTIIIGSIISLIIMLLLPSIPAIEFNFVFQSNKEKIVNEINNDYANQPKPQFIILTLVLLRFLSGIIGLILNIINKINILVNRILFLLEQFSTMIDLINQLIDFLNDLFNPKETRFNL